MIKRDSSFLHIAGRPGPVQLLKEAGCADEFSDAGSGHYSSLYTSTAGENIKKFLKRFDRSFVFTTIPDSQLTENIKKTISRTTPVITIPPAETKEHVTEFRLRQLSPTESRSLQPLLDIPDSYIEEAAMLLSQAGYVAGPMQQTMPLIALHAGSGGKRKCWPLENYLELMQVLEQEFNPFFIIFSGPAEGPVMKNAFERFAGERKNCLHACDKQLIAVAALFSQCHLYVGNDSGITHLSAAVGCSVIAIFGPTDPLLWKPQGSKVHIISPASPAGLISAITVNQVYEKTAAILAETNKTAAITEERK